MRSLDDGPPWKNGFFLFDHCRSTSLHYQFIINNDSIILKNSDNKLPEILSNVMGSIGDHINPIAMFNINFLFSIVNFTRDLITYQNNETQTATKR